MASEIERLRAALEAINADVRPELCDSELELIVWWGRQVDRLQAIAARALTICNDEMVNNDAKNFAFRTIAQEFEHWNKAVPTDINPGFAAVSMLRAFAIAGLQISKGQ